jgi:RimJ/RimL family protein N-acetyltransferase
MENIRIVPTDVRFVPSFHRCLDHVAHERRHLAFLEAPPLDGLTAFVNAVIAGAGVQVLAVDRTDTVVGWCDIVRNFREGFRHSGQLGMGLLAELRGRGVGRRLASDAIDRAWHGGMERIELEVFATNAPAIRLYEKLGFATEGLKRRARMLDGRTDDVLLMALLRD